MILYSKQLGMLTVNILLNRHWTRRSPVESTDDQPLSHQPTPARPDIRGPADPDLSQYGQHDGPGTLDLLKVIRDNLLTMKECTKKLEKLTNVTQHQTGENP